MKLKVKFYHILLDRVTHLFIDRMAIRSQYEVTPANTSSSSFVTISSDDFSSRPSSRATYKLDVLSPSEPLFDEGSDMLSPASLPNPYSPASSSLGSPSNNLNSALSPASVLSNPHSFGDNEPWISDPHINTELVDAFPSVPQAVLSTQMSRRTIQPVPSINVAGVFDPFFSTSSGSQTASLPKRNTTVSHPIAAPHTAAVHGDGTFLGRASTMPRQRPF